MNNEESPLLASTPGSSDVLSKLHATLSEIQSEAMRLKERYGDEGFFADDLFMVEELERSALSWKFITTATRTVDADRTSSMLTGPLLTCDDYPWPFKDGQPMVSVLQLDLRLPSRVRQIALGDGLLQVFMTPEGNSWLVRVIPRAIAGSAQVSPPPKLDKPSFSWASTAWAEPNGVFGQIVGLAEPVISSSATCDVSRLRDHLPEEVVKFIDRMNAIAGHSYGPTRLFGTFDLRQYLPSEEPPALVCIDGDQEWFNFHSVAASAQVFFDLKDSGVDFSFRWSR